MKYEQIDMGSYKLHLIKTKKFKTITVEVNFRRALVKEEITTRNLLKTVLLTTNQNFKSERELIRETENLYDLKLISANARIGNYSNLSITSGLNKISIKKDIEYSFIDFSVYFSFKNLILKDKLE